MADTLKPVVRETYGARSWRRYTDYRFVATSILARVAVAELAQATVALPLAFTKVEGHAVLVALLGFVQGQNLFVAPDGRWMGRYVPAAFRGWPFQLARSTSGDLTLCFNEASGLLAGPGEAEAFFAADGQPAPAVQQVFDFLARTSRSQDAADAATGLLSQHGLLEPWPLKVRDGDQERPVSGLLRVNEAALNALEAEALLALHKGGALAIAYAQLLSMGNIALLGQFADAHARAAQQRQHGNGDVAKLFKPVEDGQGMIDWKKLLDE